VGLTLPRIKVSRAELNAKEVDSKKYREKQLREKHEDNSKNGGVGRNLKIGLLNAREVRNECKWIEVKKLQDDLKLDCLCLTETHLREEEEPTDIDSLHWFGANRDRKDKKGGGGGVAIAINEHIEVMDKQIALSESKEHMWKRIRVGKDIINVAVVYMCSGEKRGSGNNQAIYDSLRDDLITIQELGEYIIIGGDFNAHMLELGDIWNNGSTQFYQFLEDTGLEVLNLHPKCKGKKTFVSSNSSTAVDFILVDINLANYLENMTVDEEGRYDTTSDHNLIIAESLYK